ncbi:MAG TPA: trigger factor [Candidatus Polarisedimenticolia bacterium]|jgi:trigger factor|nr:trigger factor [Candidatus Polarisedimenticolia bacterium]
MKVVVNELEGCKRGLEVEIPGEQVSEELEKSIREYSRHARVPGFRQGKIPLDVVRQRFGKDVRDEVVGRMVREYSARALEEKKLLPVDAPVLNEVHYEAGRPLTFKATFEVRPVVTVADYRGMAISVARRQVTPEMVAASLAELADRAAKLEEITGRPVQKGDFVVGTLSCRFLKGKGKNLVDEPLFLEAGAENNHPDFNAAILGAQAGDARSFETTYPDEERAGALRGCSVSYTIKIKELKKKVLPNIDDNLAKELGDFQSLAELEKKVKSELERRAKASEEAEAKDKILSYLVERHPIEVPVAMIDSEVDRRLESIVREMIAEGKDPSRAQVDWNEERAKLVPGATKMVRAMLILEAIAEQEGLQATEDDVNAWLKEEARRRQTTVGALKDQLSQSERLSGLRRQIVREKSLDFAFNGANITHEVK